MKYILVIILFNFFIVNNSQAITIGKVVCDGNVNVRLTPEIQEDNIVGFLPDGASVVILEKTDKVENLDGISDYWYSIMNVNQIYLSSGTQVWIFGYFLDLIEVQEFEDIEKLEKIAMDNYPDSLFVNNYQDGNFVPPSEKSILHISMDNFDNDLDYEIFVWYNRPWWDKSYLCLLDKRDSGYQLIPIIPDAQFLMAKNLIGNNQKEIVVTSAEGTDIPSRYSFLHVIQYQHGKWIECLNIPIFQEYPGDNLIYFTEQEYNDLLIKYENNKDIMDLIEARLIEKNGLLYFKNWHPYFIDELEGKDTHVHEIIYSSKFLFSNVDTDLELEIISTGTKEETNNYVKPKIETTAKFTDIYNWNGEKYELIDEEKKKK